MLNYKLSGICGSFYTGGKISFSKDGNSLFVPINNRIGVYDLNSNTYNTVNSESKHDIRFIAIHPSKEICITIDKFGYGTVINLLKDQIVLRILFKSRAGVITSNNYHNLLTPQEEQDPVNAALFTNNGKYFIVGIGRRTVIWESPTQSNNFRMLKYNDICYHSLNISSIDISDDDRYFLTSSFDLSIRLHTLKRERKVVPTTLVGNKTTIIGAYFMKNGKGIFSVNKSGVILVWMFHQKKWDSTWETGKASKEETEEVRGEAEAEIKSGDKKKKGKEIEQNGNHSLVGKEKEKEKGKKYKNENENENQKDEEQHITKVRKRKAFETGWWHKDVYYCNQEKGEDVVRICFNRQKDLLAIAYSSGRFGLYCTPEMTSLYNINMSTNTIDEIAINPEGQYIALAEGNNGTIIIWEWKCESYVLKQNTSNRNVKCVKFSPIISHLKIGSKIVNNTSGYYEADNFNCKFVIVTGNEDGTIKLYDYLSFINFATFSVHTSAVTDICFLPQGNAFISASLDGTVRAFDLLRYRNFKVYVPDFIAEDGATTTKGSKNNNTTGGGISNNNNSKFVKENVQFLCVGVNLSGNIVAAGGRGREYIVYVWNVQTAKCIDKLFGHVAPIAKICFSTNFKTEGILATCSLNKNVLIWDLYSKNKSSKFEELSNSSDISYLCFDPRGNDILAVCTLGCKIFFWDLSTEEIVGTIEGDRDIKRGRLIKDRFQALPKKEKRRKRKKREVIDENGKIVLMEEEDIYVDQNDREEHTIVNKNCYFTSVDYIHNGNYIVGCVNCSVCVYIYDTTLYLLVKMIDLTKNFCVDGIKRELHTRYLTNGGKHIYEFNLSDDEGDVYLENYRIINRKKEQLLLPGQINEQYTNNKFKKFRMVLNHLDISGDDRHIAVATNVGLYVFTKDFFYQYMNCSISKGTNMLINGSTSTFASGQYKGMVSPHTYTPKYLSEHVNVRNIKVCLHKKEYVKAFILAVALNDYSNILEVYEKTPFPYIPLCVKALSKPFIFSLLKFIQQLLCGDTLKHIHLHLYYLNSIFTIHFSIFQNFDFTNTFKSNKDRKKLNDMDNVKKGPLATVTTDSLNESKTSLLMILKHLLVVYNSLNFLYSSNANVLLYLCMKD